ncbi:rod shape-determining protein MreD [Limnoraphis robusta Tam1]|uniref:rod shape-determining protein MreD n=1 Tax=Limnoraphis robusta TaxID=1118279 RepID=UPI002B20B122|nr:rod shape-determining protein MreD [Limnoraphis robusta]MEA5499963.1 rod shape-determining protein MreD [Limnoraphis robusta BA-68 BA1]MEA5538395.1 rod shape-determining protein MreD [Limnoraphis robusta Tam1]
MSVLTRQILNSSVTVTSVIICVLVVLAPIPALELFGIKPNWLLIWLVVWSLKRSLFSAAVAGLVLGLILDGITASNPSHIFSFMLVGVLTVFIYKHLMKKMQEDFVSVALIVFGMAIVVETIRALQFSQMGNHSLMDLWVYQQQVALSSAILSSLWAPVVYFPLNRWWELMKSSNSIHY